jgi:hypothetical protein
MYMIESMIDMGLSEGQDWPTPAHRLVAANLALCNPQVTKRDTLNAIVQKVIAIPKSEIESLTWADLPKYDLALLCAG